MPKDWLICGFASVSTFARSTLPSRACAACSSAGVSCRHGPHHAAQKSTTTGTSCERRTTFCSNSCSVTSITAIGPMIGLSRWTSM